MFSAAAISPPRLLSPDQFLELVPVSRSTLARLMRAGKISPIKIGRRIFFHSTDVENFITRCSTAD